MKLKDSTAFVKDLHKILMKHGLTAISGNPEKLHETTKHLDGFHFFITKGEKKLSLRGGENVKWENSVTITLTKNRYKPENHEDDGN